MNVRPKGVIILSIIGFLLGIPMILRGMYYSLQFGVMIWKEVSFYSLWLAFGALVFNGGFALIGSSWGLLKLEEDGRQGYIYSIFGLPILYILWYITYPQTLSQIRYGSLIGIVGFLITFLIITMSFAFIGRAYLTKREIRDRFSNVPNVLDT